MHVAIDDAMRLMTPRSSPKRWRQAPPVSRPRRGLIPVPEAQAADAADGQWKRLPEPPLPAATPAAPAPSPLDSPLPPLGQRHDGALHPVHPGRLGLSGGLRRIARTSHAFPQRLLPSNVGRENKVLGLMPTTRA